MQITTNRTQTLVRLKRIAAVLLSLLVLASLLVSCGGTKIELKKDTSSVPDREERITFLSALIKENSVAREYFTAAYLGYDMTDEDFNDAWIDEMPRTVDDEGNPIPNVEAAMKIFKSDDLVRGDNATTSIIPTNDAVKTRYFEFINGTEKTVTDDEGNETTVTEGAFSAEDMKRIIEKMQDSVATQNEGGWDAFMRGIGFVLGKVSDFVFHNYILALFLFAVVIELLLLPLGIRQQKNSIKQARLRPKEMAIRNRYKGRTDQATLQKMNAEIQELYQRENFSPMSGCLPMFIQLPVIWVLYYIVIDPLHYVLGLSSGISYALSTFASTARAAGGLGLSLSSKNGTIELLSHLGDKSLSGLDKFLYYSNSADISTAVENVSGSVPNFNIGSVNFGLIPGFHDPWILLIVPVLTFLVYFGSMKLTRKLTPQPMAADPQTGCSNKVMDFVFPLFSVYIAFIVPGVVGIYWIMKSILSSVKQIILSRVMPLPTFTEEELKAAEKELAGKAPKAQKRYNAATGNPRVRSLHHIDDEDFDDTREKAERRRAAVEELDESERPAAPAAPKSTPEEIEKARLKLGRNEENKKRHKEDDESKSSESSEKTDRDGQDAKAGTSDTADALSNDPSDDPSDDPSNGADQS